MADDAMKIRVDTEFTGKKELEELISECKELVRDTKGLSKASKDVAKEIKSSLKSAVAEVNEELKRTPTDAYRELEAQLEKSKKKVDLAHERINAYTKDLAKAKKEGNISFANQRQKQIDEWNARLKTAADTSQHLSGKLAYLRNTYQQFEEITSKDDLNDQLENAAHTAQIYLDHITKLVEKFKELNKIQFDKSEPAIEDYSVDNAGSEFKFDTESAKDEATELDRIRTDLEQMYPTLKEVNNELGGSAKKFADLAGNSDTTRRDVMDFKKSLMDGPEAELNKMIDSVLEINKRLEGLREVEGGTKEFQDLYAQIQKVASILGQLQEGFLTIRNAKKGAAEGAFQQWVDRGNLTQEQVEIIQNAIKTNDAFNVNLHKSAEAMKEVVTETELANVELTELLDVESRISELQSKQRALRKETRLQGSTPESTEEYKRNNLELAALKVQQKELQAEAKETGSVLLEEAQAMEENSESAQTNGDKLKDLVDEHIAEVNATQADTEATEEEAEAEREYADGILGVIQQLRDLTAERKQLEEGGVSPEDSERYDYVINEIARLTQERNEYNAALKRTVQGEQEKSAAENQSTKTMRTHTSATKKAANAQKTLAKATDNVKKSLKRGLTAITKYIFGFRSLFFLVRKLRSAVKEGLENLVQFDSANNKTNEQISQLRSTLLYLKNAWAAAVAPVLNVVIPILNVLIRALAQVGNAIGMFFARLTGQSSVIQAVETDMGDYAKSLDKSAGSSGKAAKAADKLHDRLAAFDDLNVLGKDDETDPNKTTGGGGGGDTSMPNINDMFKWDVPENYFADLIREAIDKGDFTSVGRYLGEKIKAVFNEIEWDDIRNQMASKIKWITTFLNGLLTTPDLFGTIGRNLAEAINTGIMSVRKFVKGIKWKEIFANIGDGLQNFLMTLDFAEILSTIMDTLRGVMQAVTGFLEGIDLFEVLKKITLDIADFLMNYDWKGLFTDLGELIGALAKTVWNVGEFVYWVIESIVNYWIDYWWSYLMPEFEKLGDSPDFWDIGKAIITGTLNGIVDALKNIGQWIMDNIFKPFWDGVCNVFDIHSPSKVMEEIGMNIVEGMLNGINNLINTVITPFVNLKNKLIELWSTIKSKASEVWGGVKTTILNVVTGIKNNVVEKFELIRTKIVDTVTSMKDTVVGIWEGIWNGIKGIINNILGGVESLINGMIGGINKFADILNGFSFELPEALTDAAKAVGINITDNTIGFDLPKLGAVSIPRLAQGAVIPPNKEFLAMLGDQSHGTNIEAPLDTIKQALAEVMGNIQVENTGNAVMELDGQTFARLITPYVVSELDRRGYNVQVIGG